MEEVENYSQNSSSVEEGKSGGRKVWLIVGIIVFVVIIGLGIFFFLKSDSAEFGKIEGMEEITISPSLAICGYKKQVGPSVPAGELSNSVDCLDAVLEEDESYGIVSKSGEGWNGASGAGVGEIYFETLQDVCTKDFFNATIHLEIICSSGIGLYFLTEFDEWARFGEDLPSEDYKPDGSYGYLSCRYGAKERKSIVLPIEVYNHKAGVRLVKEEATAYAMVDLVELTFTCSD